MLGYYHTGHPILEDGTGCFLTREGSGQLLRDLDRAVIAALKAHRRARRYSLD